jgi:hypothetical protein
VVIAGGPEAKYTRLGRTQRNKQPLHTLLVIGNVKLREVRAASMKLVTIQSQLYGNASSNKLKPVPKAARPDNGQQERPKCWLKPTKNKAEVTNNGLKKATKKLKEMDKRGVGHKVREPQYPGP